MDKNINSNLLNALFVSPTPLPEKAEVYHLLFNRIFPDREGFINFLSVKDSNEKLEICKNLIQRLCFESNFPPSFDLLINLLSFEESDLNKSSIRTYVPQDHFMHILNSYIFGIYLFFYHPTLNKKITAHFMGKRPENNVNPILNATKDFISFWKYFCLFHDISYPVESAYQYPIDPDEKYIENLSNKKIILKNIKYNEYLKPFEKMDLNFYKEGISIALSRYIAVYDLLSDFENRLIRDVFINKTALYFCVSEIAGDANDLKNTDILETFKEYTLIDKLFSYDHIKMFTSFFNKKDILVLLMDKYTDCPIAFKYYNNDKALIYKIKHYYSDLSSIGVEYYLNTEEDLFSNRFQVRFCLKNCEKIREEITFSPTDINFEKDYIKKIKNILHSQKEWDNKIRFELISESNEIENYIFNLFKSIYHYFNELVGKMNIIEAICDNYRIKSQADRRIFTSEYKQCLSQIINSSLNEILNIDKIISDSKIEDHFLDSTQQIEDLTQIIDSMLQKIFKISSNITDKERFCNYIKKQIDDIINSNQQVNNVLINIICIIGKALFPNSEDDIPEISFSANEFKWDNFISSFKNIKNDSFFSEIFTSLNGFLKPIMKSGSSDFVDGFVKTYHNKYFPLDHGITGLYVYLLSEWKSYKVLERVFAASDDVFKKVGRLIWNVSCDNYKDKLINNYKFVSSDVAKSIMAHNIYSTSFAASFPNSIWKIDLDSEPCCYFSMLVDALQIWGRKKYNHTSIDYDTLYMADSYNVDIRNKKLNISIRCDTKNIDRVLDKFFNDLDEYLADASSLTKISLESK